MSEAERPLRVRLFSDSADEFRFSALAGNGEVVATSEGYARHADALDEARKLWPEAEIQDETQAV